MTKSAGTTKKTKTPKTVDRDATAKTAKTTKTATKIGKPLVIVELPRTPGHHFGTTRHVQSIAVGDILYVGSRHFLSHLQVLSLTTGEQHSEIVTSAISFWHEGREHTKGEIVVLRTERNTQLAVAGSGYQKPRTDW